MAGVIQFNKALTFFKKKFGNDFSGKDIYDEFLFSNEIDLFIQIMDASVCEFSQSGFSDDAFFIHRIYPHSGYARIKINEQIASLLNTNIASISINEITGIYNAKKITTCPINASLFNKDIDYNYYNSIDQIDIFQLNKAEEKKKVYLDINLSNLFFSRDQLSLIGLNLDNKKPESYDEDKLLHIKERKSVGLIIAALAELAKIDISTPNSDEHKKKLLPLINLLAPDGKEMNPKTLAKYFEYAIEYFEIKTKTTSK